MLKNNMRPDRRRLQVSNGELIDSSNHRFDVYSADTPTLQEQAYRLRYQVYCIENCFENPLDHPLEQEVDEFDAHSAHSVIIDRPSQIVTGAVRIILPDPVFIENSFPIQLVCSHPLLQNSKLLDTARSAEISRFAVSKEFRRRASDSHPFQSHIDFKNNMQNIVLWLMKGILRMSVDHGITDLFAVMEPTLLRLLTRFGIYFTPIGPMVDYHGIRQPCHTTIEILLDRVRRERADVWEIITDKGRLLDRMNQPFTSFRLIN
jgi:N-acyl amino acid synthase of PEP-CTERM/exosortase system